MQFSIVAVAFFAGAVMAGEQHTVYQTESITITSCAPTVTDCPARSTVTSVTSYPVAPTSYPVVPTSYPSGEEEEPTPATPEYPVETPSHPVYSNGTTPAAPAPTSYPSGEETPAVPETPEETASYSTVLITTCIPTVITSSVLITPTPVPATTYAPVSPPFSTGTVVVPGNSSSPTTPPASEFTGAASAVRGSIAVAAAAGFAAFFL